MTAALRSSFPSHEHDCFFSAPKRQCTNVPLAKKPLGRKPSLFICRMRGNSTKPHLGFVASRVSIRRRKKRSPISKEVSQLHHWRGHGSSYCFLFALDGGKCIKGIQCLWFWRWLSAIKSCLLPTQRRRARWHRTRALLASVHPRGPFLVSTIRALVLGAFSGHWRWAQLAQIECLDSQPPVRVPAVVIRISKLRNRTWIV